VTPWTRVQRLSPKNKGGLLYISLRAGYRNAGTAYLTHGHVLFHWLFNLWGKVTLHWSHPRCYLTFLNFVLLLHSLSLINSLIVSHYLPSPTCLPAAFPPLMLRPSSRSKSFILIWGFIFSQHHYMSSCLPGKYTCHLTCKFSPWLGLCRCFQYPEVDRVFSYYGAHIKVHRYWPFGVVSLCLTNKLPSASEAWNL
jgi:hypothetical protein